MIAETSSFLVDNAVVSVSVWETGAILGLLIHLINERRIHMGDIVLAVLFGVFYLISQAWGWETVVIELPARKDK